MRKIIGLAIIGILFLATTVGDKVKGEESASDKEAVFWKRVWPSEAPVETCNDSAGKPYPGTGPNSFTWFHWGGAGAWKVFTIDNTDEPLCIKVSGDSQAINTLKFNLLEDENNHWAHRFRFDGPVGCWQGHPTSTDPGYRLIFWATRSRRIRIEADSLYIEIYQRGKQAQQPEPTPLEDRIKALIIQLGHDDWQTREKAQHELEQIGAPAKPFLEAALKNKDPEIVLRARLLLEKLQGEEFIWGDLPDEKLTEWTIGLVSHLFNPVLNELAQNRKGGAWHEFDSMGKLALPGLIKIAFQEPRPVTQMPHIISLLVQFHDKSIIPTLGHYLLEGSPEVSAVALGGLKELRKSGIEPQEIDQWLSRWEEKNQERVTELLNQLKTSDLTTRTEIVNQLFRLGTGAVRQLDKWLKDDKVELGARQVVESVVMRYWLDLLPKAFRKVKEIPPVLRAVKDPTRAPLNEIKIVDGIEDILSIPTRFYQYEISDARNKLITRLPFGLTCEGELLGFEPDRQRNLAQIETYLKPVETTDKVVKTAVLITRLALLCKQCPSHEIPAERYTATRTADGGFEVMVKVSDLMVFPEREKDIVIRFNKEGKIASVEGGPTHMH